MGIIHEFFYDNKWLGILMVLAGLTYSGFLYFRAYEQWIGAKRQDSGRRLRHHLHQVQPKSEAGKVVRPPAAAAAPVAEGQQEDLLSRLARDEDAGPDDDDDYDDMLPSGAPTSRDTRTGKQTDPAYRSTHILKPVHQAPASGEPPRERTPLQNAIRAAVDESLRDDTDMAAQSGGFAPSDAPPIEPTDDSDPLITDQAPPSPPPARKRSSATHAEAQRRAQRHEDMGLHREVQADHITDQGVRRISDDDRKRRLSQLGIAFDNDTFETEAQRRARLGTDELDDILGRLDAALATPSESSPAPAPVAEAAPIDPDQATAAAAPTTFMDQDALAWMSESESKAPTVIADPAPTAEPGTDGDQSPSDDDPEDAAEAEADEEDVVLREGRTTTGTQDDIPGGEGADEIQDANEDEDEDEDSIPDWARADTFDDDDPKPGGAEQQKLF